MLIAALALAQAASVPAPPPTPRDLYVGCFLVVQGNDVPRDPDGSAASYSASTCMVVGLGAIANREGYQPGARNDLRFCLPDTVEVQANPIRAMAAAYVDWFERVGSRTSEGASTAAYVVAMDRPLALRLTSLLGRTRI